MIKVIEDRSIIDKLVSKLRSYIMEFERSGVPFEKIFNCERVKHDYYGNNFYCFKDHGANHCTYRMLYRFVRKDKSFCIEPHVTVLKRHTAKDGNKDYIKYFTKYAKEYKQV